MEVFVLWFSVILKNIFWKRVSNFINRSEHRGLPWTVRETKINHVDTKTPIITTGNEKILPNRLFLLYYQFYFLNIRDPKNNLVIYPKNSLNPQTPDRFTLSHARCAENCGSALIRQKIGTFFILNDVIKGWLVWINIVFFFSISFVRISYKTIWLETWPWYKNPVKNNGGIA